MKLDFCNMQTVNETVSMASNNFLWLQNETEFIRMSLNE